MMLEDYGAMYELCNYETQRAAIKFLAIFILQCLYSDCNVPMDEWSADLNNRRKHDRTYRGHPKHLYTLSSA